MVFHDVYETIYKRPWTPSDGRMLRQKVGGNYQRQKQLLDEGDPAKWDPTLLCLVLLDNMWNTVLSPNQRLAISDLKEIRNEHFAHASEASITSENFAKIVGSIEKAYRVLFKDKECESSTVARMKLLAAGKLIIIYMYRN